MQHSADAQGYFLCWQSGEAAEGDPASTYPQGLDGSWDFAVPYDGALCAVGAEAYMGGQERQWGFYGGAYDGCYEAYDAVTYDASPYGYSTGCGSSGRSDGCVLNLDQYSDASDIEEEKEPEEETALAAGVPALAPGVAIEDTSPNKEVVASTGGTASGPMAEVPEPAPEPMHGGVRGAALALAVPAWAGSADRGAGTPQTAGSAADEEASSATSEPEAEASGSERELLGGGAPAALTTTYVVAAAACSGGASWRAGAAAAASGMSKLQVSNRSWAAQQRARRASASIACGDLSDADVVRRIKSILNKLTIEKFSVLYQKLVGIGIKTAGHARALIREVFQKATTQHHFVDMYADLCALLQEHFQRNPVADEPEFSFKRLLLNECQASFERNLAPPAELQLVEHEERTLLEFQYKTRMVGNIRLIGALLTRKMLAGKAMFSITEALLECTTPEALESLAVLLTVVGPTFDTPDWQYYRPLDACFQQVKAIIQKASCNTRTKCLLKDLLDLRARRWQDSRPKRCEGPLTLEGIARQAAAEERSAAGAAQARAPWMQCAPAGTAGTADPCGRREGPLPARAPAAGGLAAVGPAPHGHAASGRAPTGGARGGGLA